MSPQAELALPMNTATWPWMYLGKPSSLNIVSHCIQRCDAKLFPGGKKKENLLSDGQKNNEHMFCVQRSLCLACSVEK